MSDQVKLIIPTPINLLTAVNAELLKLNAANEDLSVELPSLRRRALLVINETGVLPIQSAEAIDDSLTR